MTHLRVLGYRTDLGPVQTDLDQCTDELDLARDLLASTLRDWADAEQLLPDGAPTAAAWRSLAAVATVASPTWQRHSHGMTVELTTCERDHLAELTR